MVCISCSTLASDSVDSVDSVAGAGLGQGLLLGVLVLRLVMDDVRGNDAAALSCCHT